MFYMFYLIIFAISVLVGAGTGYIFIKLANHDESIEDLQIRQNDEWYDLIIKCSQNSNRIEYLEKFLKMKYPDMDDEMMEGFSKPNKE